MTRRFEQHCNEVTVKPYCEKYISREALTEEEQMHLPAVHATGYGRWCYMVTGFPADRPDSGTGGDADREEQQLLKMGNVPLGRYLFTSGCLTRDYIRFGLSETHWARCSRLCLAGKPLLLTEVFLPASPAYPA